MKARSLFGFVLAIAIVMSQVLSVAAAPAVPVATPATSTASQAESTAVPETDSVTIYDTNSVVVTDQLPSLFEVPATAPAPALIEGGGGMTSVFSVAQTQTTGPVCSMDQRSMAPDQSPQGGLWWWRGNAPFLAQFDEGGGAKTWALYLSGPNGQFTNWLQSAPGLSIPVGGQRGVLRARVRVLTEETSVSTAYDKAYFRFYDPAKGQGIGTSAVMVSNLDANRGWFDISVPFQNLGGHTMVSMEVFYSLDASNHTTFLIGGMTLQACGPLAAAGMSARKAIYSLEIPQLTALGGCQLKNVDGSPYRGRIPEGSSFVCVGGHCLFPFRASSPPAAALMKTAETGGLAADAPPNPGPPVCGVKTQQAQVASSLSLPGKVFLPLMVKDEPAKPAGPEQMIIVDLPESELPWWAVSQEVWEIENWPLGGPGVIAQADVKTEAAPQSDIDWGYWGLLRAAITAVNAMIENAPAITSYERWQALIRYWEVVVYPATGIYYEGFLFNAPFAGGSDYSFVGARPDPGWPPVFVPTNVMLSPDGRVALALTAKDPNLRWWLGPRIWMRDISQLDGVLTAELERAWQLDQSRRQTLNLQPVPVGSGLVWGQVLGTAWPRAVGQLGNSLEPEYTMLYEFSLMVGGQTTQYAMWLRLAPLLMVP